MISIVTSYYNRRDLFHLTLKSITKSKFKDVEVIAVDDGSLPEHRIEDFVEEFPFLKVVRVEPEDKWYVNCCIPFNMAIREAKGDIIVLQNPECLHANDVLTYLSENVNESNYISVSTYGLDSKHVSQSVLGYGLKTDSLPDIIKSLPQVPYTGHRAMGWYNHSKFRPEAWHFCSAMTRENMAKLNGFDERYVDVHRTTFISIYVGIIDTSHRKNRNQSLKKILILFGLGVEYFHNKNIDNIFLKTKD